MASKIVENGGSLDDGELLLDGISRLCNERTTEWIPRVRPLIKRVLHLYNHASLPGPGRTVYYYLLALIATWLGDEAIQYIKTANVERYSFSDRKTEWIYTLGWYSNPPKPGNLIRDCFHAVAENVRNGIPRQLLSFPSHAGFGIAPDVLLERLRLKPPNRSSPVILLKMLLIFVDIGRK